WAMKEAQEGAELGGIDHVWTALRVHVAQVVEDEYDPGASLGLRERLGVEDVLLEGRKLRRLLDRRYRADRVWVGRRDGVRGGAPLGGGPRGGGGVVVVGVGGGLASPVWWCGERRETSWR